MARIPNNSDASSMWKLNDVYVARNGDEWPDPYQPPTLCAFSRSTGTAMTGIYTGLANGAGTNNSSGYPITNGWGHNWNSANAINMSTTTTGSEPNYQLKWVMLPSANAGYYNYSANVLLRICVGSSLASGNRVYESLVVQQLMNGADTWSRFDLPSTGTIMGNNTLSWGTNYWVGMVISNGNYVVTSYWTGNYQYSESHTVPSGSQWTMSWNSNNVNSAINAWSPYSNNGTTYQYGMLGLWGIEA